MAEASGLGKKAVRTLSVFLPLKGLVLAVGVFLSASPISWEGDRKAWC